MLQRDHDALGGSFGFYRALPTTAMQNAQRRSRGLTQPVLAMGGAESAAGSVGATMQLVADDVQSMVIPGVGHWVAEQAPDAIVAALGTFLAPYRKSP
jgi:pimeloyl-ACP methyl ester carboxylesterase